MYNNMFTQEGSIEKCNYKDCSELRFLVEINNNYLKTTILPYLDSKKHSAQLRELEEISSKKIIESHFLLCKKHLDEIYKYIIDIFNSFSQKDEQLKIKNDEKLNQIGFSKFPFNNISELFAYKVND